MIRCRHPPPRSLNSSQLYSFLLLSILLFFHWSLRSISFPLWPHKRLFKPWLFFLFTSDLHRHFGATSAISLHRDRASTHASFFQVMSLEFGLRTDWHHGTTSPGELVTFNIRRKFKFSSAEESQIFSKTQKIIITPDSFDIDFLHRFSSSSFGRVTTRSTAFTLLRARQVRRLLSRFYAGSMYE